MAKQASLVGAVTLLGWGVPATCDAVTVAELASAPGRWAVFGYEAARSRRIERARRRLGSPPLRPREHPST